MNNYILKFILLFKPVFNRFDVNTDQLAVILSAKLKMDDRRPNAFMTGRQQQKKTYKNSSWVAMLILVIIGCIMLFFLTLDKSLMGHSLYFSMFMVMIALTLIADFTNVLIDVRDNYIILPRPVKDSTLTVSRILHITIHVSKLVFGLCLPGLIALIFFKGVIAGLVFIIEVISATALTIFIVNIVYLVVLKVTSPQRFKDFISYFQIIFSVVIFASYQMLPRLINSSYFQTINVLSYKISYVLPPVWFASFYDIVLYPQQFTWLKLILATVGLVMPFVCLFVVIKVLAPGFNRKLSSISGSGNNSGEPDKQIMLSKKVRPSLSQKLSFLLSNNCVEQAGFKLTWWLTSRYRDFKIKVYPSFAYVPVYFVYFLFVKDSRNTQTDKFETFRTGSGYIFLTYLTSFVILTVLQQITQSEKFKASWVMFSTPHNEPGRLLSGMFKALIVKYFFPYYLAISIFSLIIWGPVVLNDLLFAFFNIIIFGLITALFTVKYLPFSQPINTGKQGGKIFITFFIMGFIGLMGFIHYGLSRWEWVITVLTIVSAAVCWLVYYYFQKRDWKALEADYN